MANQMSADAFLALLDRWNIPVEIPYSDWKTHNHNAKQPRGDVQFIVVHHVGDDAPDDADARVLHNGRSDLPGPLCNWGLNDEGAVVPIGWGTAYHAGAGDADVLAAVQSENYGAYPPRPNVDSVNGNPRSYGQETMYSGKQRMTNAAYKSTVLVCAAVCSYHGWSAKSVIGHKEWTARKPDPASQDMADLRADIQDAINAGPGQWPIPVPPAVVEAGDDEEDAMKLVQYGNKIFIRAGLWIRPINDPADVRTLVSKYGNPETVGVTELKFLTNMDTFLTIVGDTRGDVADDATGTDVASLRAQITNLQAAIDILRAENENSTPTP
jgi:N-acetylmuramoyl-L-alanine amidase-like protein